MIDTFRDTSSGSIAEMQRKVEPRAIGAAVATGADPVPTTVVESEAIPITYTTSRCRFYVKAAGQWTGTASAKDGRAAKGESAIPAVGGERPPLQCRG